MPARGWVVAIDNGPLEKFSAGRRSPGRPQRAEPNQIAESGLKIYYPGRKAPAISFASSPLLFTLARDGRQPFSGLFPTSRGDWSLPSAGVLFPYPVRGKDRASARRAAPPAGQRNTSS